MHSSAVSIVDALIQKALKERASDIHLEPERDQLRVRFRIDGELGDHSFFALDIMPQIIARLKVLAHIDVAEKRVPQDGKFSLETPQGWIDFRVSAFPSIFGQKIVVRILNKAAQFLSLESLGLSENLTATLRTLIKKPHGVLLVSGPTGSGKTTTLYALLSLLNTSDKNIITLEDPVEYHIRGITQGNINPDTGFTFQRGIRAMLRQDPDVLMIGEIRDQETARIAIEAALTGHLVLSTIHTNDAPSAIIRLMEMGIEPYLLNAALIGVVAQRLVRTLCTTCKKEIIPQEKDDLEVSGAGTFYKASGCDACRQRGYKGRTGIFELCVISDELRKLIHPSLDIHVLKKMAVNQGMTTLEQEALAKMRSGIIDILESRNL